MQLATFERSIYEPIGQPTLEPLIVRELGLRRAAEPPWAMLAHDGTRLTTAGLHVRIQRNQTVRS